MDEKIIELIRSQKDKGLMLMQQQYSGLMHYIVRGILQNKNDIEECISDISVKVWHSIESYSPEKGKFSTWLTVISRNTALNYLKRRHTKHDELKEETADTSSLEDDVLRRERAEELKCAISTLSFEEQHIFYRKYYYLQRTSQIAAELGMTERSVEGKLYRLRKKLQKKLGGDFR
ncbi:sigma-70 family RNA polymerase sigma factor [Desulfotomaculum sp. 1211_IL3151]|uniref:sigma-70 family RNA polymerase sigma factor n=1 Tax=Desulfotomaculum sp. 1211_IL3151 TaxID=3084055 RepID=UPI002FDB5551